MTGREHYAEAERWIERADAMRADDPALAPALATAQVHATLALAAATSTLEPVYIPGAPA